MSESSEILSFAFSQVLAEFVFILVHHYLFDQMLLMPGVAPFFYVGGKKHDTFSLSVKKKRSHSK